MVCAEDAKVTTEDDNMVAPLWKMVALAIWTLDDVNDSNPVMVKVTAAEKVLFVPGENVTAADPVTVVGALYTTTPWNSTWVPEKVVVPAEVNDDWPVKTIVSCA